jgi:hypothetical protein
LREFRERPNRVGSKYRKRIGCGISMNLRNSFPP